MRETKYYHIGQDYYGGYATIRYNKNTQTYFETVEKLLDLLPHGSGINRHWDIVQSSSDKNVWYGSNCYEAMDETGMYCHNYDFTVKIIGMAKMLQNHVISVTVWANDIKQINSLIIGQNTDQLIRLDQF